MEQLFAAGQENLQNFLALQESLGNAFAKMYDLNTQTVKNNISNFTQASKTIANSKTPQEQTNAISQALAPIQQQVIDYNKQLFDLFSQVRQDIQSNVEDIQQDCQKYASATIENISKNAPLGTEPFISYLKSAVSASSKVFEGVSKATQQAVSATTNNLKTQAEQIIQETQKVANAATSNNSKK
ncbi:MAG: phasin [Pseudomonadota bacterium]|jgi:phasin family protein